MCLVLAIVPEIGLEIVQVLDTDCVIGLCIDGIRNDCNFGHICFRNE